jgi:hypothetical protein
MVVPATPPLTDQVTVWAGLPVPLTTAVKAWVPPFATLGAEELTVTLVTVTVSVLPVTVTVTVAVPLCAVSTVEVAVTVRVAALSPAATVRRPAALMALPPLVGLTDQVTVWAGSPVPITVAAKAWDPPFTTLAVGGLTVTPETVGVPPPSLSQPVSTSAAVTTRATQIIVKLFLIIEFLLYIAFPYGIKA